MNVFVLCVFGLCYSTYSASIPVTFDSKDNKIDDRDYPVFQDLKHFDERLHREPKNSSSVLVSERTTSSKGFPEELCENTEGNTINPHRRLTRSVWRDPSTRWPNKVIPYVISPSIRGQDRQMIYNAIDDFHQKTCLKFRERSPNDQDYVSIKNDFTGCFSNVGKKGGEQVLNLESPGCYSKGTIIHELLHTVGFVHEQSRPDRDDYIKINYENIKEGNSHNFAKYNENQVDNQGLGYDYNSLMHYGLHDFSKNDQPTMEAKHSTMAPLKDQDKFSEGDLQKVWKMYQCTKEEIGDGRTTIFEIKPLRIVPTKPTTFYPIMPPRPRQFEPLVFIPPMPPHPPPLPRQFLLPSATHPLPGQIMPPRPPQFEPVVFIPPMPPHPPPLPRQFLLPSATHPLPGQHIPFTRQTWSLI